MFDLVTPPELNILTYRLFPHDIKQEWEKADPQKRKSLTEKVNQININVQRLQREAGKSFVSRTTLKRRGCQDTVVLRAVLMNPMTNIGILNEILDEQEKICKQYCEI